jgi:hypothetical protein
LTFEVIFKKAEEPDGSADCLLAVCGCRQFVDNLTQKMLAIALSGYELAS